MHGAYTATMKKELIWYHSDVKQLTPFLLRIGRARSRQHRFQFAKDMIWWISW